MGYTPAPSKTCSKCNQSVTIVDGKFASHAKKLPARGTCDGSGKSA